MGYEVRKQGNYAVVVLTGDVDLERSPEVRKLLLEQIGAGHGVIVDLSAVSYIDSSGVASLVEAFQNARKRGSDFALASVSQAAMRVLELARLDKIFTIHASLDAVKGG
jgi:anti-sigma B factor antagonist